MRSVLGKIYAYKALDDLILIYPLYAVMFVDHGVSPSQLALLFAVWSAVGLALEVPSGVLADHLSRKHLLAAGQLIRAAGYACWLLFPSFWGYLAGFVLWGIKGALQSGTFEALVYDELDRRGAADDYAKVIGRARASGIVAILVAMLAASGVHRLGGYELLMVLSVAAVIAAAVVALALPSAPRAQATGEVDYLAHLKQALGETLSTPAILRPMLVVVTLWTLGGSLDEFWGIYGEEAGLSRDAIPIYYAATYATSALAAALAYRLSGAPAAALYGVVILAGGLLIAAADMMSPAGMLLLAVFAGLVKLIDINFETRMQHAISTERRATIASLAGFLWTVGSIGLYLAFGQIAERWSYGAAFMTFGVVMVLSGAAFLFSRAFRRI
ncbi:MAG: MFS transporter [Pseudomonadota bacterium]|uniref:MFS transporter n=1 Tax=Phenylobacterium sp. TaxID=1871053 RepID=UPI0025E27301|nr:MFS transporter [Phenylobacterium sp.]MBT9473125.1 MFS transporter [Phenylobacterium sp.]